MTPLPDRPGYMPQLDGLRALAITAVLVQHAMPGVGTAFPFAHSGVLLFFVLSGFLITGLLLKARDRMEAGKQTGRGAFGEFFLARVLRIWPLYFLVVGLGLAIPVEPGPDLLPWLATFTTNWCLVESGVWVDGYFHLWTLAVVWQFYMVWPLVILFAPRRWLLHAAIALVVIGPAYRAYAVASGWDVISVYCATPACLDSLGLGALLAIAGRSAPNTVRRWCPIVVALGLLGVVAALWLKSQRMAADAVVFDLSIAAVFAVLVRSAAVGFGGVAGWFLTLSPITYLGRISYGVYVYHVFIPAAVVALYRLGDGPIDPGMELATARGPVGIAALILLVILIPALSWQLLERPLTRVTRGGPVGWPVARLAVVYAAVLGVAVTHHFQAEMARGWVAARANDPGGPPGTTYYLSPAGDDAADGTTPATAWRTLKRATVAKLAPGDAVLLEGGRRFDGPLELDTDDAGTPARPVTVSSYGTGRATIVAGDGDGIRVRNTMGVCIRDLTVIGSGLDVNTGSGVVFENALRGDVKLPHIRIERVESSGFGRYGVLIDGNRRKSGFRDVRLASVEAHDNALGGIVVNGEFLPTIRGYTHADVTVADSAAYRNPGISNPSRQHTGNGIVLSDVDGAVIERCRAFGNGGRSESLEGGPVGIWVWDANAVIIRHNEAFDNRTAGPKDGGGFDLDGGVTNSVMHDNLSHGNDGAGYLLAQFPGARRFAGNVVRNNVSRDDGRKNGYGGIHLWGYFGDCDIRGNTVSVSPAASGIPAAVVFDAEGTFVTRVRFECNRLSTTGGLPLIDVRSPQGNVTFDGKPYAEVVGGGER